MKRENLAGWMHAGLLLALTLVTYAAALDNGYMWDDSYFIHSSAGFDSLGAALDRALSPLFPDRAYVRPLPLFSLYLETLPLGRNAVVSHAINLGLHLASVLLVYGLALSQLGGERVARQRMVALVVAAMFAVHPALVEAVAWVSSRFDLMVAFFMLLGLTAAARIQGRRAMSVAVGACFFLAALCKESAVVFPFVVFVFEYLRRMQAEPGIGPLRFLGETRSRWLFASLLLAGLAYLVVRHFILANGYTGLEQQLIGLPERLARASSALFTYLSKTLLPWVGLSPQHTFIYDPAEWRGRYAMTVAACALVLGATAWLMRAGRRAGWLMAAVLFAYLPVLHLVPLTIGNNLVHERFMYFPTAILFAGLPALAHELRLTEKARRFLFLLAVLWILVSIAVARSVVPLWKDELSLWEWTTRMDPLSDVAAANLIHAYLKQHRFADMEKVYQDMVGRGMPVTVETYTNMGNAQQGVGDYAKALEYYQKGLASRRNLSTVRLAPLYGNMSVAYLMIGENQKARDAIATSLGYNPQHFMSIGILFAYCDGQQVDASRFRDVDLARAQPVIADMREQLKLRSAEALANPNAAAPLCPPGFLAGN